MLLFKHKRKNKHMTHEGSAHHNVQKKGEPYELAGTARELLPDELAHYGIAESDDPGRMRDYVAIRGERVPSQANPDISELRSGAVCLPMGAEAGTTLRILTGRDADDVPQWLELSLDELTKTYPIEPGQEFTIGRSEKATHRLEPMTISSIHAHITRHTDGRIIVSSSATNPLVIAIERPNPDEESHTVELIDEEAKAREQHQIMNGMHELSTSVDRLRSSLEADVRTASDMVGRVDGLMQQTRALVNLAQQGQVTQRQVADLTETLKSLYSSSQNPNVNRATIVASNSIEGAADELVHRELSDDVRALVNATRRTIEYVRSWRIGLEKSLDINSSSGNLVAQSGQFLGRIQRVEAMLGYRVSQEKLVDGLTAINRDLATYSSKLTGQVGSAKPILDTIDQVRGVLNEQQQRVS